MQLPEFLTKIPIAHRGLHDRTHPENSLSAFREAIGCGYAIETDVRFSKDGKLVVFHDDTVDRMTDASGRVEAFTAADLSRAERPSSSRSRTCPPYRAKTLP